MKKYHEVREVIVSMDKLKLVIDRKLYEFNFAQISQKLEFATDQERKNFIISPSGYGIHWPLIDEDISIDGLLKLKIKRKSKRKI